MEVETRTTEVKWCARAAACVTVVGIKLLKCRDQIHLTYAVWVVVKSGIQVDFAPTENMLMLAMLDFNAVRLSSTAEIVA